MMRLLFKGFLLAFIVIGLSAYLGYVKTGKWPWDMMRFKAPDIAMPSLPKLGGDSKSGETNLIYKWKDSEGGWHYSSELPEDGAVFEQIDVDPNANVMDAVKVSVEEPEPESDSTKKKQKSKKAGKESDEEDPALYSPEGVKKLMDDAKNVQELLNDRAQSQKDLLNQI